MFLACGHDGSNMLSPDDAVGVIRLRGLRMLLSVCIALFTVSWQMSS
jgi:hypothetical protein